MTSNNAEKIVMAPCSDCVGKRRHRVLFETSHEDEQAIDRFAMIECCGCSRISLAQQTVLKDTGSVEDQYYPSPVSRKEPAWVMWLSLGIYGSHEESQKAAELMFLLREIYQAVAGRQYRLAAMGIRALLEQVMILKVGDLPTFDQKLDAFQKDGFISAIQRETMRATLDVGDAAMHRGFKPSDIELNVALDIVEGVIAPIFNDKDEAKRLKKRVPPRGN